MASWRAISLGSLNSAKRLLEASGEEYLRSSVSRAYYAAYAAVAWRLPSGTSFPEGRKNPTHDQLAKLASSNLKFASESKRRQILKALKILRRQRETADYRPGHDVSRPMAVACTRWAGHVLFTLGVMEDARNQ